MNENYVYLLLIDIQNNILLLNLNQYTGFLYTKINNEDNIPDNNIPSSKNALIRLIKEKFKLLTSYQRLDDITLYDITGNKLPVYIHRINEEEKKLILSIKSVDGSFTNINNLPSNLDILSSSISQAITSYPNLIINTTNPPSTQKITYSTDIKKYNPEMEVPLLMPFNIYQEQKENIILPTKEPVQKPVQKPVQSPIQSSIKSKSEINIPVTISDVSDDELVDDNKKSKLDKTIIEPPKFNSSMKLDTDLETNKKKYLEMEKKYLKYKEKYLEAKKAILTNAAELTEAKIKIMELEKNKK